MSESPQMQNSESKGAGRPRFAVLRHAVPGADHWDLMFEDGGALATWRSPQRLADIGERPVQIERIGDHRLAYLQYEGPVSRNRGHVSRDERGTFAWLERQATGWRIQVRGERTRGSFALEAGPQVDVWTIRRLTSDAGDPGP